MPQGVPAPEPPRLKSPPALAHAVAASGSIASIASARRGRRGLVEDPVREAVQTTEEANQEGDAKENNQEDAADGDGKENIANREAMELWHKLLARLGSEKRQKQFSNTHRSVTRTTPHRYNCRWAPVLSFGNSIGIMPTS